MRGSAIRPRPIATICCSPPESVPASCCWRSFSAAGRWRTLCRAARCASGLGCAVRAHQQVVEHRHVREKPPPFRDHARCRRRTISSRTGLVELFAIERNGAALGLSSPASILSVVVLPAPFAPISATISPSGTSKQISHNAWTLPVGDLQVPRRSASGDLFAEICLDHAAVAHDVLRRRVGDLDAVVEHQHAVGDFHDRLHLMFDQDHGDAVVAGCFAPASQAASTSVGLSPPIGSSRNRILGRVASAARDFEIASARPRSGRRHCSSLFSVKLQHRERCAVAFGGRRGRFGSCRNAASITFSSTVNLRKGLTIWKVRATPLLDHGVRLEADQMLVPSSRTAPVGRRDEAGIRLNTVVLPAPFGPIRPRISPCVSSNDRSDTARKPPKSLRKIADFEQRHVGRQSARGEPQHEAQPAPDAFGHVADDQHHEEPVENQVADWNRSRKISAIVTRTDRADDRPAGGGKPADHGDEHHLDRQRDREHRIGVDVAEIERVEAAGQPDHEGGKHQRQRRASARCRCRRLPRCRCPHAPRSDRRRAAIAKRHRSRPSRTASARPRGNRTESCFPNRWLRPPIESCGRRRDQEPDGPAVSCSQLSATRRTISATARVASEK